MEGGVKHVGRDVDVDHLTAVFGEERDLGRLKRGLLLVGLVVKGTL